MPTLFPKRVDIDQESVQQLQQLFSDSTIDLQSYIFTLDGHTISRGNIAQVRSLIQQRLVKLGVAVGIWVSTAVPQQYMQGMSDNANQKQHFGEVAAAALIIKQIAQVSQATKQVAPDIITPETENVQTVTQSAKVISPIQKPFDLHAQSVQATMDSMSNSFASSIQTMGRSADNTISSVQRLDIRKQIAVGVDQDTDVSKISQQISEAIKNNGISALTDAGGKQWSPEGYANMLVNTKLTEARNNGMMNSQLSSGSDLVEVSSHGATDVCADWEGEILSISGNSSQYDSVDDAIADGLFHPNCQHSLNAVDPDDYPDGNYDPEQ